MNKEPAWVHLARRLEQLLCLLLSLTATPALQPALHMA